MRIEKSLSTLTNITVILAVVFALGRPSGPVGNAVVGKYRDVLRRRVAAEKGSTVSQGPRVDSNGAKVALVEFAAYECPACRRQYPELHAALGRPTAGGLVFRHLPLPIHK